tara:strand:- start:1014 stop:1391 length:378 start_codon:yes stop_codon:yes gene_type:complete
MNIAVVVDRTMFKSSLVDNLQLNVVVSLERPVKKRHCLFFGRNIDHLSGHHVNAYATIMVVANILSHFPGSSPGINTPDHCICAQNDVIMDANNKLLIHIPLATMMGKIAQKLVSMTTFLDTESI